MSVRELNFRRGLLSGLFWLSLVVLASLIFVASVFIYWEVNQTRPFDRQYDARYLINYWVPAGVFIAALLFCSGFANNVLPPEKRSGLPITICCILVIRFGFLLILRLFAVFPEIRREQIGEANSIYWRTIGVIAFLFSCTVFIWIRMR